MRRYSAVLIWISLAAALFLSAPRAYAACDSDDPQEASNDCDDDGVTVGDGDCDDEDPDTSPDLDEICGDDVDNNCDGEINEECTELPEGAVLSGGGQCSLGVSGTTAGVWGVALLLASRRRNACF